jgi:predicted phosphodiesterase
VKTYSKIRFIGDIHGSVEQLNHLQASDEATLNILLGDVGFGFGITSDTKMNANTVFIRGNHDRPDWAVAHPAYLGEYGIYSINDGECKIGFLSGECSIDKDQRTVGVDWWPEEELGYSTLLKAINFFAERSCDYIVSHGPSSTELQRLFPAWLMIKSSATSLAMNMIHRDRSSVHFFGHMHISRGDRYSHCVGMNEYREIDL